MTSEGTHSTPAPATPAPPVIRRKKSVLKTMLWVLISLCGAFLLLVAGILYFKDSILRTVTEYNVRRETGMETKIGDFQLGLTSTSLLMKDFQIINPKEFGGSPFFQVPEVYVELDPEKAAQGLLHFKELRFNLAEVNIVKNKDGKLNLDYIQEALEKSEVFRKRKKKSPKEEDFKFEAIDRMFLTVRSIKYTDLQEPANSYKTDLGIQNEEVKNIKSEEELNTWAVGMMTKVALQQMFKTPGQEKRSGGGLESLLRLFKGGQ